MIKYFYNFKINYQIRIIITLKSNELNIHKFLNAIDWLDIIKSYYELFIFIYIYSLFSVSEPEPEPELEFVSESESESEL